MSILVAGIGNVFRGDGGFGVRLIERLSRGPAMPGAVLRDFGVRELDLAYALLEGHEAVVVVDAAPCGRAPGTLTVLELDAAALGAAPPTEEARGMGPRRALRWARRFGPVPGVVRVVGCEPAELGGDGDVLVGLSRAVEAALEPAAELVRAMVRSLVEKRPSTN